MNAEQINLLDQAIYWLDVHASPQSTEADVVDRLRELRDSKSVELAAAGKEKYDDTLLPFLALMRNELHANSGKGDREAWLKMPVAVALAELTYHVAKLQTAVAWSDGDRINEHAGDVANIAMMVTDICGSLGLSK